MSSDSWARDIMVSTALQQGQPVICARALLIGLGSAGILTIGQVAQTVHEISRERLPLLCFVGIAEEEGTWTPGGDVPLLRLPPPPPGRSRREGLALWQEGWEAAWRQLQPTIRKVLSPGMATYAHDQGFKLGHHLEVYLVGDLTDSCCNTLLLALAERLRQQEDMSCVIIACLSVARRNEAELSSRQRAVTFATLRELNCALSVAPTNRALEGLLDHCYLVDRTVEAEVPLMLEDPGQAMEVLGGGLIALLLAQLRNDESARDLFRPGDKETGLPVEAGAFNGLGYAAVRVPLGAVIDACARAQTRVLVRQGLLGGEEHDDDPEAPREAPPVVLALSPEDIRQGVPHPILAQPERQPQLGARNSQWANELRLAQELWQLDEQIRHERGLTAALEEIEDETVAAIRADLDRVLSREIQGYRRAEDDLAALDQQLATWEAALPPLEPHPEQAVDAADRRLRQLVNSLRPPWAYLLHLLVLSLILALVGWTLPLDHALAFVVVILPFFVMLVFMYRQRWRLIGRSISVARGQLWQEIVTWQRVQVENMFLRGSRQLYLQLRTDLGETRTREEGDPTERDTVRRWRDVLLGVLAALPQASQQEQAQAEVPYGERALITREVDFQQYHLRYTPWQTPVMTRELLAALRLNPRWRAVQSAELRDQILAFCRERYREVFRDVELEFEGALELLNRDSQDTMADMLQQLRVHSELLLLRQRTYSTGDRPRLRYLLVGKPETSLFGQLSRDEGLVAVARSGPGYLAVLQIERHIPLPELLGLGQLRAAYEAMPEDERALLHVVDEWAALSTLQPVQ